MPMFLTQLGWVDACALAVCLFLVIRGFWLGCSGEVGRLVAVGSAAAAGVFGFAPLSRAILAARLFADNPHAGRLIVFIILFVLCIAIWLALSRLLSEAIRLAVAQPFDAILGGVIGGFKAFVLVSVLCAFGLLNPDPAGRASFQRDSVTARNLAPWLERVLAPGK